MDTVDERIKKAFDADREGIRPLLHDPSPKVVMALLANRDLTEDDLWVLAKRRDLPSDALGAIAARKFTDEGYKVKVALANNPKTPRRSALGIIRQMRLRDLAYLTANRQVPTELRQAAEGMFKEKLPTLPIGIRTTLARLVSEDVVKALLMDGTYQLTKACFENPRMKEAVVLWAVNHAMTPAAVIEFITANPRWSACYSVRFALTRNPHTPVGKAVDIVRGLKATDQRYLYNDPAVPVTVKVQIEIELEKKGQPLSPPSASGRIIGIPDETQNGLV